MSQQNECKLNKELLGGIMELSFPRTFAPGSESSIGGTFAPWNIRSLELSFPRTFAPGSEITVELSLSNINVIIYVLTQ